ncbi:MAG: lysophospholipid acyltransferase family protein [Novosphingobium sp.]
MDKRPQTTPPPTAGDVLRSLAFYALFYGGSLALVAGAVAVLTLAPARFRAFANGWAAYHRLCVRHLLGVNIAISGALPGGPLLVACKHESFFEAIDMPNLVANPAVFAKAELMRIPLWGKAAAAYGLISVAREQGAKTLRTMVAAARKLSAEGRPLVIFPEGTRVPHGQRLPLQAGFAGLYKLLGLPVVPIAVRSGTIYHRRWKRRGTIQILIGDPIPPGLPREEIEARVLTAINALNDGKPE